MVASPSTTAQSLLAILFLATIINTQVPRGIDCSDSAFSSVDTQVTRTTTLITSTTSTSEAPDSSTATPMLKVSDTVRKGGFGGGGKGGRGVYTGGKSGSKPGAVLLAAGAESGANAGFKDMKGLMWLVTVVAVGTSGILVM